MGPVGRYANYQLHHEKGVGYGYANTFNAQAKIGFQLRVSAENGRGKHSPRKNEVPGTRWGRRQADDCARHIIRRIMYPLLLSQIECQCRVTMKSP
jgi:hypothetical protein